MYSIDTLEKFRRDTFNYPKDYVKKSNRFKMDIDFIKHFKE